MQKNGIQIVNAHSYMESTMIIYSLKMKKQYYCSMVEDIKLREVQIREFYFNNKQFEG